MISGWRPLQKNYKRSKFISRRSRKGSKEASIVKLATKKFQQDKKSKNTFGRIYSILVLLYPPTDNPNRRKNNKIYLHEIQTDVIDLFVGLKSDDIWKKEELPNLTVKKPQIYKDKTLTQLYVSRNMSKNKDIPKENLQKNHYDKNEKNSKQTEDEYEECSEQIEKTISFGSYQKQ